MKVSKTFRFEAAHYLPMVPQEHKCGRLHGHSYTATVVVDGAIHEQMGWVVDFSAMADAIVPVIDELDHRFLNDIVGLDNPTSERIAEWIYDRLNILGLSSVTVSETCTTSATYP